ncbi:DUF4249 domain-containing protein [Bacteroidota bacterium]
MMKKYIVILPILFSSILLFNNCEKVEDVVDFPVKEPTLVLNCFFSSDSTDWVFQISKSLSVIDNAELKLIPDAKVKLMSNNVVIAQNITADKDGLYRHKGFKASPDSTYSVEVTHPKLKTITASDVAVRRPDFEVTKHIIVDSSTYYYDPNTGRNYGWIDGSMTLKIKDDPNEDNYYRIRVYFYDSIYKSTLYNITSDNPAVENNYYQGLLLSDYLFNGQSFEITFDFEDWEYYINKDYYITVEAVSKAFFYYERSYWLFLDRQGDPFSEPVQIYNNIVNGYGIFANMLGKEIKYPI